MELKSWSKPGDPPMLGKGTGTNRIVLDGRYLEGRFEGMMMGMKTIGFEYIGYDLIQNKYETFWIDNMSTWFMTASGTLDAAGTILTQTGMSSDPMSGGMQKVREVTTLLPDGKYKFELFMVQPDGKEFKSLEYLAAKKK